jgi:uncharacterized protein YdiU (UPF0061 family)
VTLPQLDDSYVRLLHGLYEPWQAAEFPDPQLLVLNDAVAGDLGFDLDELRTPQGVRALAGQELLPGSVPVAMAYAGHQFGNYSPRLGDGRALLLGEVVTDDGRRFDLHLKGSGRTRFARGGDGKAAVGPMLREHQISEAMHALGIPTTRSLAVITTGETITRDALLPGALLTRVASSHLRVGTFQFAAATGDLDLLARLAAYAIDRHHPEVADESTPYLALYTEVLEAQAALLAQWMGVGFIHGVMNTDNMTISGETIDYGPCAFMDRYHPGTVFSSIDTGGRYAYANQPGIAQWNLARLAEAMLPLFADEPDAAVAIATEVLQTFPDRYRAHWLDVMQAKLGLPATVGRELVDDLLVLLEAQSVDWTQCFRAMSSAVRGDAEPARDLFFDRDAFDAWLDRWRDARATDPRDPTGVADAMDRTNPVHIPRNHLVENVLDAATAGDLAPFLDLLDVVTNPYDARPDRPELAQPAPQDAPAHRTFCGT